MKKRGKKAVQPHENVKKLCRKNDCFVVLYKIPYLTVQKAKKAEKRDIYAKKWDFSFLPRFPKLS